jgi:hypothetical protein
MGEDAAIGDHQGAAVAGERQVVRADAARIELADAGVAGARVPDADDAAAAGEVVLELR